QNTNLTAGYPPNQEWDGVYDGVKPDLKRMWAMQEVQPVSLRDKYNKLAHYGAILDDIDAEHGRNSGGSGNSGSGSGSGGSGGGNAEKTEGSRKKKKVRKS